jgi:hypothetical protein
MHLWIATSIGLALLALGLFETFMAVLHPRAVTGPVTSAINRVFHGLLKRVAGPQSRANLFCGPLLIVVQILCWATLLLLGVSLVVWPQLGSGIEPSGDKPTETHFMMAVYFAGYTITTLGIGDLVPQTDAMRALTITVAGLGFSFFTLVLAYVLSIYSTLARRNRFANEIDYRTGRTGDTLRYVVPYLDCDDPSLINQDLYTLASDMADLLESHHFYPTLHYFRFSEPRYAMSRVLRVCLETASLFRALRAIGGQATSVPSEPVDRLWHASLQMLQETSKHFVVCRGRGDFDHDALLHGFVDHRSDGSAKIDIVAFRNAFLEQARQWQRELDALEACTRSGRKS